MGDALATWAYLAMLHVAPVEKLPQFPGFEETLDERRARYTEIAGVIGDVCSTSKAPRNCAALLVAIGYGESAFSLDADRGPRCFHGPGHAKRCDADEKGRDHAASIWQVQPHGFDAEGEPVTVAKLFADRKLAATIVLRVARSSIQLCRKGDPRDVLSALSGRCQNGPGPWRARMRLYQTLRAWEPKP